MCERQSKCAVAQLPVVFAPVVFHPSGMCRVLVQVLRTDVVMLTFNRLAQAS
jgi:hypothetical protein